MAKRVLLGADEIKVGNVSITVATKAGTGGIVLPPVDRGVANSVNSRSVGGASPKVSPRTQQPAGLTTPQRPQPGAHSSSAATSSSHKTPAGNAGSAATGNKLVIGSASPAARGGLNAALSPRAGTHKSAGPPSNAGNRPDWVYNVWSVRESKLNPWMEPIEPRPVRRNIQQEMVTYCKWDDANDGPGAGASVGAGGASASMTSPSVSGTHHGETSPRAHGGAGGGTISASSRTASFDLAGMLSAMEISASDLPATVPAHVCVEALGYLSQAARLVRPADTVELSSLVAPPPLVEKLIGYVSVLLRIRPQWAYAKKTVLKDASLLAYFLRNINPARLKARQIRKATMYASAHLQGLDASLVAPLCRAAVPLAHWVQSFHYLAVMVLTPLHDAMRSHALGGARALHAHGSDASTGGAGAAASSSHALESSMSASGSGNVHTMGQGMHAHSQSNDDSVDYYDNSFDHDGDGGVVHDDANDAPVEGEIRGTVVDIVVDAGGEFSRGSRTPSEPEGVQAQAAKQTTFAEISPAEGKGLDKQDALLHKSSKALTDAPQADAPVGDVAEAKGDGHSLTSSLTSASGFGTVPGTADSLGDASVAKSQAKEEDAGEGDKASDAPVAEEKVSAVDEGAGAGAGSGVDAGGGSVGTASGSVVEDAGEKETKPEAVADETPAEE